MQPTQGNTGSGRPIYPALRSTLHFYLGLIQFIIGIMCFGFQTGALAIDAQMSFVAAGIWGGVFFFITGIFAMIAAKTKEVFYVRLMIGLSLISAILGIAVGGISAIGMNMEYSRKRTHIAMNCVLIALGFTEMVFALLQASLTCDSLNNQTVGQIPTQVMQPQPLPAGFAMQPTQQLYAYSNGQMVPVTLPPQQLQVRDFTAGYTMPEGTSSQMNLVNPHADVPPAYEAECHEKL